MFCRKTIKETEAAIGEFTKLAKKTKTEIEKCAQTTAGAEEEIDELSTRLGVLTTESAMTADEKKEV